MSDKLIPSKSTVYVSNLPFSLTNNDLHKIFEKCGKIVKVTILRDKETRESKGVAFILFLKAEFAKSCVRSFDGTQIGGRTIRANIAVDNGRSKEFIRKRVYDDKSKCYECGEEGHLSYECPSNTLGIRKPPVKKHKKSRKWRVESDNGSSENVEWEEEIDRYDIPDLHAESLGAAIKAEHEKMNVACPADVNKSRRKRIRKSAYFSDEEELSE